MMKELASWLLSNHLAKSWQKYSLLRPEAHLLYPICQYFRIDQWESVTTFAQNEYVGLLGYWISSMLASVRMREVFDKGIP